MAEYNRDGRPDTPYYDNQLNSVIVDIGEGNLAIRTTGGGGGGGDATATNQQTQIDLSVQANDLLNGISVTLGDDGGGSTNQLLQSIEDKLNTLRFVSTDNHPIRGTSVALGGSLDVSGNTVLAIINKATGNCVTFNASFSGGFTGITDIEQLFQLISITHSPVSGNPVFDFSRYGINGSTLSLQPLISKSLNNCTVSAGVMVVTIQNAAEY